MKFFNSSNNILIFFLVLFIITILSTLFFTPSIDFPKNSNENFAKIELNGFNMYQINKNFIDMKIQGSKALEFQDYEIIYDFSASRFNQDKNNLYEYINGEEAIREKNIYRFPEGVVYTKSDGGSFWSERGTYYYQKEQFVGEGKFVFNSVDGIFMGKNIFYDKLAQELKAIDITSDIVLNSEDDKRGVK